MNYCEKHHESKALICESCAHEERDVRVGSFRDDAIAKAAVHFLNCERVVIGERRAGGRMSATATVALLEARDALRALLTAGGWL